MDGQEFPSVDEEPSDQDQGKAIEIANALLAEGTEEGQSIAIGTARAKEWAASHRSRGTST